MLRRTNSRMRIRLPLVDDALFGWIINPHPWPPLTGCDVGQSCVFPWFCAERAWFLNKHGLAKPVIPFVLREDFGHSEINFAGIYSVTFPVRCLVSDQSLYSCYPLLYIFWGVTLYIKSSFSCNNFNRLSLMPGDVFAFRTSTMSFFEINLKGSSDWSLL